MGKRVNGSGKRVGKRVSLNASIFRGKTGKTGQPERVHLPVGSRRMSQMHAFRLTRFTILARYNAVGSESRVCDDSKFSNYMHRDSVQL